MNDSIVLTTSRPIPRIETWPITRLTFSPGLASLLNEALASDISGVIIDLITDGQTTPVLIGSDGTVWADYEIAVAAQRMGWQTIDVLICDGSEQAAKA